MIAEAPQQNIYIVLSQTGTILSRLLKLVTKKSYNHASISFDRDLYKMYSFGRRHAYNPFWGGFVEESPHWGTFKRFPKTEVLVLSLPVSSDKIENMHTMILDMLESKDSYSYNLRGLCLAAFNVYRKFEDCYYCSEFVKEVLCRSNVDGCEVLGEIVHPVSFLDIPQAEMIYRGRLCDYAVSEDKQPVEVI